MADGKGLSEWEVAAKRDAQGRTAIPKDLEPSSSSELEAVPSIGPNLLAMIARVGCILSDKSTLDKELASGIAIRMVLKDSQGQQPVGKGRLVGIVYRGAISRRCRCHRRR